MIKVESAIEENIEKTGEFIDVEEILKYNVQKIMFNKGVSIMYYSRPKTDDLEEWKKYAEYQEEEAEKFRKWYWEEKKKYDHLKVLHNNQQAKLVQARTELKKKKYDAYVEEDHLDYLALEERCRQRESTVNNFFRFNNRLIERIEEIRKYVQDNYGFDIDKIYEYSLMNIEARKEQAKEQSQAGRPSKFDDSKIALVKMLRSKGYSMRDIAKELDVSVGTIHRILHLTE